MFIVSNDAWQYCTTLCNCHTIQASDNINLPSLCAILCHMFHANKHKDSVVHFKKSIFDEHIQEGLVSWAKQ